MLDFLLRHVTVRNFVIAGLMAAAAPFAARFGRYAHWRYMQTFYPPVRASESAGEDIKKDLEKKESDRFLARHQRVSGLLAQAKADGFNVAGLDYKAGLALSYNVSERRAEGASLLTEIEMSVPKKKVQYIPIYEPAPQTDMADEDDTPVAKPGGEKPSTKASKAAAKKSKRARKRAR